MGANRVLSTIRRVFGSREEQPDSEISLVQLPLKSEQLTVVVILWNHERTTLRLKYRPEQTVRDVCKEIAKEIGITPLVLPFFTLVSKPGGHYLNLQKKLSEDECKQGYEFRLAFKACRASAFKESEYNDLKAAEYLFQQCRQEFIQGSSLTFSEEEDKKCFVKLILLELIYTSRKIKIKPVKLLENAKQHKVSHLLRKDVFAEYSMKEVKSYLKKHLHKFQDLSDKNLMFEYLHVIEQCDNYFVHKFTVWKQYHAHGRSQSVKYELLISPQYGIKKRDINQPTQYPEEIVKDFSQVHGVEIGQINNMEVVIHRMSSKPEVLLATSTQDAQSIVAIIDGYYRLFVNRYKNLVINGHAKIPKYHGPIKREMSMSLLQGQGQEDGLFLIRQSRKVFGDYVLSLCYNKEIKHYEIEREEDGHIALKDTTIKKKFKDLDAFVKYYKESQDGLTVCLKKNCLPSSTSNDALLNYHPIVPVVPRPQDLKNFGLECIDSEAVDKDLTIVGKGEFGNVYKSVWSERKGENPTDIVIRKLKKKNYDQSFFEEEKKLIQLRHLHVIRYYGVTKLREGHGMVIEYAFTNLEHYLKECTGTQSKKTISIKHVILFAAQIAEGMMYLQGKKCIHGRLSAHNVLVVTDDVIKIGDIGLIDLQNHGGEFMFVDKDHVSAGYCWHSIEKLSDPKAKPTFEGDVWSFGVTMWEMFVLKRPFHFRTSSEPMSREEILKRYHRHQYLNTERDNLPKGVADVIQKCWSPFEEKRISFAKIVTDLRDLVIKATPEMAQTYSNTLILDQQIENWEKPLKQSENNPTQQPIKLIAGDDSYSVMAASQAKDDDNDDEIIPCGNIPGSPKHVYEEPMNEDLLGQPKRKVSLTETSFPQPKSFASQKEQTSNEELVVPSDESKEESKCPVDSSSTPQESVVKLDSTMYHDHSSTHLLLKDPSKLKDEDEQAVHIPDLHNPFDDKSCPNSSLEEAELQEDVEECVMNFLQKIPLKNPNIHEGLGSANSQDYKHSNSHRETNLGYQESGILPDQADAAESIHGQDHDSAMQFLGSLMQQQNITTSVPLRNAQQSLLLTPLNTSQHVCRVEERLITKGRQIKFPIQPSSSCNTQQYVLPSGQLFSPGEFRLPIKDPEVDCPIQPSNSCNTQQYVLPSDQLVCPGEVRLSIKDSDVDHPMQPASSCNTHQYVLSSGKNNWSNKDREVTHIEQWACGDASYRYGTQDEIMDFTTTEQDTQFDVKNMDQVIIEVDKDESETIDPQFTSGISGTSSEDINAIHWSQGQIGGWFCAGRPISTCEVQINGYIKSQTPLDTRQTASYTGNNTLDEEVQVDKIPFFDSFHSNAESANISKLFKFEETTTADAVENVVGLSCVEENPSVELPDIIPSHITSTHEREKLDNSEGELKKARFKELIKKIKNKGCLILKENLRVIERLGHGNFGIVRRGLLSKHSGNKSQVPEKRAVAVKELKKNVDEKSQEDFINEAINMVELAKIDNENIITLIGICLQDGEEDEEPKVMIVTELAPLGDLPTYLKTHKDIIGVDKLLDFCRQIAKGMASLENENVLHRDLALRNILVATDNLVKISDFGLSRLSDYYKARSGKWPIKWYAPESLLKNTFTTKSDVWSFGITVWEMFTYGDKPYPGIDPSKILDHLLKGERLRQPENCPEGVYKIMQQCWKEDSLERPSFYYLYTKLLPEEMELLSKDH